MKGQQNFFGSVPKNLIRYATWNPQDKSADITLSGGNLIAQSTNAATDYQVRSTIQVKNTSVYWENTFVRTNPSDPFFVVGGISKSIEPVTGYTGKTAGACLTTDGNYYVNGVFTSTGWGAFTDGDVIAFTFDGSTLKAYKNNTLLGTIVTGLSGGYWIGTGSFQTLGTTTTNFGASAMVYTPPAGFLPGVYIW